MNQLQQSRFDTLYQKHLNTLKLQGKSEVVPQNCTLA